MNIGIVVPYFTPYIHGNEYGLARSLSDMGHKVTIITSIARAPREKDLTKNTQIKELKYHFEIKYLPTFLDFGDNPIVKNVKDYVIRQDILMLQEDYPDICHKAYTVAKQNGIPTILSSERTYYPKNFVKLQALKILDVTKNKSLRNGVNLLTAHCTAAKEFIQNELGAKRDIRVINVGVDTDQFKPLENKSNYLVEGDLKLLTVARLHKYKGLEYLIRAMKTISLEVPETHLYILGKGQEETKLKELLSDLQLTNKVTFISTPIPNNKMPELYAECDVYVQPSIIEPYGIAVLEAMACGKPVVGTNIGGMRDTIKEGECGFLAAPGNTEDLADKILKLKDKRLRNEFGVEATQRAREKFEWNKIALEYSEILNDFRI